MIAPFDKSLRHADRLGPVDEARPSLESSVGVGSRQRGGPVPTLDAVPPAAPSTPAPPTFLRLAAGFVYFYFGFLKFFPDLSPAELLASETIMRLSGHMLDAAQALFLLAILEVGLGLAFLFGIGLRWMFFVFVFHQISTFLPLFLLPELTFKIAPFSPTMEGQYIFKNLISLAAGWTVMWPAVKAGHEARKARRLQAALAAAPLHG